MSCVVIRISYHIIFHTTKIHGVVFRTRVDKNLTAPCGKCYYLYDTAGDTNYHHATSVHQCALVQSDGKRH